MDVRKHCSFRARNAAWLIGLMAAFAAATGATASSAFGTSCGQMVIQDWLRDGVVDDAYAAACYASALRELPQDARMYSSAESDIIAARALSATGRRTRELESAQPALAAPADSSTSPRAELKAVAAGAVLIATGAAASIVWRRRVKSIRES
jgi:hypothetical protein